MDKERDEKVLAALADPTRRQLLDILAAFGEATATTLATQVTISRQAVVKHLMILEKAGIVSCNRVGREMRYSVSIQQVESTAQWMADLATGWDRKLKSIKDKAETDE